jgi:hypothetical protein
MYKKILLSCLLPFTLLANDTINSENLNYIQIGKFFELKELTKEEQKTLAKLLVNSKEVIDLKGKKVDKITNIKDIYISDYDKTLIIYEFISDFRALGVLPSQYSILIGLLRKNTINSVCADKSILKSVNLGLQFVYLYKDTYGIEISKTLIDKNTCSSNN